jgi:hypothetical protein
MIFRLSQKLNRKIKVGVMPTLPLDENPLADWSTALFVAGRTPYILLSNTKSLYSTVLHARGITNDGDFIDRALSSIRGLLEGDGQGTVFERFIASASGSVRFARALDRSVTGSMNELTGHAAHWLAETDLLPFEVGVRLNDVLLSALARSKSLTYGKPREAFKALLDQL